MKMNGEEGDRMLQFKCKSVEKRIRNLKRTVKNSVMMKQEGMKAAQRHCDSIIYLTSHAGHVRKRRERDDVGERGREMWRGD